MSTSCQVRPPTLFLSSLGLTFGRVVKESGLVCVSYGRDNDDKVFVRKQIEAGVDAVIVDSVLAIRNELTNGGIENGIQNARELR
jgi:glycerophosphodiester phosphodiesterase